MAFITRRLAFYAVAAWVAITVNFAIPRVMPGNAVDTLLAKYPTLDANSLRALEAEFGTHTHGSLISQYFTYLGNLAHGNLGTSVNLYPAKVTTVIAQTLPWTLILVGTATVISFAARHAARHLRRVAARRLARPHAAGVHVPAGDALLLPGADRDRAVRGELGPVPVRPGLQPRPRPGLGLVVHLERDLPLDPAGADDHRDLDGRLDAPDAQRDDHDDLRGLRAGRAGQGSVSPAGDVQLRGPQRDPAQHRRVRAVDRLRRRRARW